MIGRLMAVTGLSLVMAAPASGTEVVPVPQFDGVGLSGGGTVTIVPGPVQRVTIIEGSSQITHIYVERGRSLKIDVCEHNCPQNYRLRVEIQTPRVPYLAVNGGGIMTVAGGFGREAHLIAAVNGGGRVDARAVDAGDVTAAVNGGGQLLVRASTTLTGAVHGGGSIRYWGSPAVTTAISGGGNVTRGD